MHISNWIFCSTLAISQNPLSRHILDKYLSSSAGEKHTLLIHIKCFINTDWYKVNAEIEGIHSLVFAEGTLLILTGKVPAGRECTLSAY